LPLLFGVIAALCFFRNPAAQRKANLIGIGLSSLYMIWTFAAQGIAEKHFAAQLDEQGIAYDRLQVTPTPLNSILWEGIAQDDETTYFGNYSLLDKTDKVTFRPMDRNTQLLEPYLDTAPVQTALWFSAGLYCAQAKGDVIHIYATKFGPLNLEGPVEFVFPFIIKPLANGGAEYVLNEEFPDSEEMKEGLWLIWERLWGI